MQHSDDSFVRIGDGPHWCKSGVKAVKSVSAHKGIGACSLPIVNTAISTFTAEAKSIADTLGMLPLASMEQGLDENATTMTTMLSSDTFRVAVRTLQALHAGIIESTSNGHSLFKSHATAKSEQNTMYEVGKLIGSTALVSSVDVTQIKEFFQSVQRHREIQAV
eukprot:3510331-Amphidinium_carterae.2